MSLHPRAHVELVVLVLALAGGPAVAAGQRAAERAAVGHVHLGAQRHRDRAGPAGAEVRGEHDRPVRVTRRRRRGRRHVDGLALAGRQPHGRRRDRTERGELLASTTCQPTVPLVPPSEATSPNSTPVQVPGVGLTDVGGAEVAHALRERVRGEPAQRVDQDQAHPRVQAVGRVARIGVGRDQPVLARRDREVEDRVVVLQALVVGELRAGRVVQRGGAGLHVRVRPEGRGRGWCTTCGTAPVLVTVTGQLSGVPGRSVALSELADLSSVAPVRGAASLIDSASCTAL